MLKDESEWEFVRCPSIVSVELWEKCNKILNDSSLRNKRTKPVKQLFAGYLFCHCGHKMYVRKETKKYICRNCRNKILVDDTEVVFHAYLNDFLTNRNDIQIRLNIHRNEISTKEKEIKHLKEDIASLNEQLEKIMTLYQAGEIPQRGFSKFYNPIHEQVEQKEVLVSRLQGSIDALKIQLLSSDQVIEEAKHLQKLWETMTMKEKRKIVENVLQKYIVGENEIEIIFNYLPSLPTHPSLKNSLNSSKGWVKGTSAHRIMKKHDSLITALSISIFDFEFKIFFHPFKFLSILKCCTFMITHK
jgi:site-specific DNA recombinase